MILFLSFSPSAIHVLMQRTAILPQPVKTTSKIMNANVQPLQDGQLVEVREREKTDAFSMLVQSTIATVLQHVMRMVRFTLVRVPLVEDGVLTTTDEVRMAANLINVPRTTVIPQPPASEVAILTLANVPEVGLPVILERDLAVANLIRAETMTAMCTLTVALEEQAAIPVNVTDKDADPTAGFGFQPQGRDMVLPDVGAIKQKMPISLLT